MTRKILKMCQIFVNIPARFNYLFTSLLLLVVSCKCDFFVHSDLNIKDFCYTPVVRDERSLSSVTRAAITQVSEYLSSFDVKYHILSQQRLV